MKLSLPRINSKETKAKAETQPPSSTEGFGRFKTLIEAYTGQESADDKTFLLSFKSLMMKDGMVAKTMMEAAASLTDEVASRDKEEQEEFDELEAPKAVVVKKADKEDSFASPKKTKKAASFKYSGPSSPPAAGVRSHSKIVTRNVASFLRGVDNDHGVAKPKSPKSRAAK